MYLHVSLIVVQVIITHTYKGKDKFTKIVFFTTFIYCYHTAH